MDSVACSYHDHTLSALKDCRSRCLTALLAATAVKLALFILINLGTKDGTVKHTSEGETCKSRGVFEIEVTHLGRLIAKIFLILSGVSVKKSKDSTDG